MTVVVWDGNVTQQDTHEHLMRLAAHRYWPPGLGSLTDLRTVSRIELPDPAVVMALFDETDVPCAHKKAALVTPEFFRRMGLENIATQYGMERAPFTELEAACEYLGVDLVVIERVIEDLHAAMDADEFRMQ